MRKSIVTLACSLLLFQAHAEPELKGSPADLTQLLAGLPRTATITGEGELKVPADRAIITLKITTENKSLQGAMRLNQDLRGKLINYLKEQGISADRVQASKFSSTPKHGVFTEKVKSYQVENFMKITAQDEKEFQAATGALDAWPEVQYQGIEFEHGNKDELKQRAIAKACDNAGERRKVYEEKFGVRLVPKRFSEGMVGQGAQPQRQNKLYVNKYERLSGGMPSSSQPEAAPAVLESIGSPFGDVIYTAEVTVEYSVEPK